MPVVNVCRAGYESQGALAPQRAPVDGGDADNIEEELETKTSNTEIGQLFDEMESSESLPSFEELEASRLAIEKIFEEPDASECLLDQDESEEAHADSNSLFSDLASEETESPEHLFGSSEPEGLNVESSFS